VIGHLLETDTCIYIIKRKPQQAIARLQSLDIATVAISSVTLSELEYGVAKSSKPEQNRLALAKFVAPLEILPYDDQAAVHYGRIRAELERRGTPIGPLDTLAAAHALALDATLVTNNVREFSRVPGLVIETLRANIE
jgi:tRNA(fMet)-specific endonuclease VapC